VQQTQNRNRHRSQRGLVGTVNNLQIPSGIQSSAQVPTIWLCILYLNCCEHIAWLCRVFEAQHTVCIWICTILLHNSPQRRSHLPEVPAATMQLENYQSNTYTRNGHFIPSLSLFLFLCRCFLSFEKFSNKILSLVQNVRASNFSAVI
jgi:hypothetical protein